MPLGTLAPEHTQEIQDRPGLLDSARWADRFRGGANQPAHDSSKIAYAAALQQQQAEHMAQLAATNKDVANIVATQQRLRMQGELTQARIQHMHSQEAAQTSKESAALATKIAQMNQDAEENTQTGNMVNAINDSYGANKNNPKAHFTSVNPGDFPQADKGNPVIADYYSNRAKYLAPAANVTAGQKPVPVSAILDYAKAQGRIGYHEVAAPAEAKANSDAAAKTGLRADKARDANGALYAGKPYTGSADWELQNRTIAQLEAQYPGLKTVGQPATQPDTGEGDTPAPPAIDADVPAAPVEQGTPVVLAPTHATLIGGQPAQIVEPPAGTPVPAAPVLNISTPPPVGTVDGGHKFKGGNPADPASWEPVQ